MCQHSFERDDYDQVPACVWCGEKESHLYPVLWPASRMVTAEQLIAWAQDDHTNEKMDGEYPTTLEQAIDILNETGSVTLGRIR